MYKEIVYNIKSIYISINIIALKLIIVMIIIIFNKMIIKVIIKFKITINKIIIIVLLRFLTYFRTVKMMIDYGRMRIGRFINYWIFRYKKILMIVRNLGARLWWLNLGCIFLSMWIIFFSFLWRIWSLLGMRLMIWWRYIIIKKFIVLLYVYLWFLKYILG